MKRKIIFILLVLGMEWSAAASRPDIELAVILKNCGEYCERLKKSIFSCTCLETVKETIRDPSGKKKQRDFLYDYQIVGQAGKVIESRVLQKVDGVPVAKKKNAALETEFYSHYSIYVPIILFSRENQAHYRYKLLKREKLRGVQSWVLEIEPASADGISLHGRAWLDHDDSSVLRIDIAPEALGGFEKQKANAMKMGATLSLTDTHWYELARDGIRFPTRTEIREKYEFNDENASAISSLRAGFPRPGPGNSTWNRSLTSFSYDRYRFFYVRMQTTIDLDQAG